jgi:hypothetical protein
MTKRHLTIVNNLVPHSAPASPRRLSTNKQGQFQLELKDGDIRHILIVVMDQVHGSRFASAVDRLPPVVVVDLRQTLRFDQPGLSRASFFDHLTKLRAVYMREPIEWHHFPTKHINHNRSLPTRLYHEAVERWEGHIALLVSKFEHARYLESMLNMALMERRPDGWEIEHVG